MTNMELLKQAGLIEAGHTFSREDHHLIESLTKDEVNALISVRAKVGEDFLHRNTSGPDPAVGIVF